MHDLLIDFSHVLRRSGLPVSPAETLDALQAVTLMASLEKPVLRAVLATTLVKQHAHLPVFDETFERFFTSADFSALPASVVNPQDDDSTVATLPGAGAAEGMGQGGSAGSGGGSGSSGSGGAGDGPSELSPLADALLRNDVDALQQRFAEAQAQLDFTRLQFITQRGVFMRQLLQRMGLDALNADMARLQTQVDQRADSPAQAMLARLQAGREALIEQARSQISRQFALRRVNQRERAMRDVDMSLLREFQDVEKVVRRMARKLAAQHSRRQKQKMRGKLDVRATLRRNLAHDGILFETCWRQRRKDRPRLLVICDVSRSVSAYSRFLLLFLYSLQDLVPKTRTFVFSARMGEVTDLFSAAEPEPALDEAMAVYGLGSTDYGEMLRALDRAVGQVDRRTTVLMLGDARNNNGEAEVARLARLHRQAKQLLWLTPETRSRWGSGDSEMLRYAPHCTRVDVCRSLGELERIIDRLLR